MAEQLQSISILLSLDLLLKRFGMLTECYNYSPLFAVNIVYMVSALLATTAFADASERMKAPPENFTNNIFGGENANPRKFKFYAFVLNGGSICGGTILDTENVLTAAHCVDNPSTVTVIAGSRNPFKLILGEQGDGNEQIRRVDRIVVHHNYDPEALLTNTTDIAILKLRKPFKFNNYVGNPVVIPNPYLEKRAKTEGDCMVAGFGLTGQFPVELPNRLQEFPVKVRSTSFCSRMYSALGWSWNSKLICIYEGFEKNICFGDSGGPLVCFIKNRPIQLGIPSFVITRCALGYNGFVRTRSYRKWIRKQQYVA